MQIKRSEYFIPFQKHTDQDGYLAQMIKGGFIQQNASGIYTWLNLGMRSLDKLIKIIETMHNDAGLLKILMPITQEANLWQKSGRYNDFGSEMLKFKDRKDRNFVFGPSAEEMITNLMTKFSLNKSTFPINLYNIQWKFRDEIRPRFGVIRSREFLMKDAYSFHTSKECLMKTYKQMFEIYSNIFKKLNLQICTLNSDTGLMGGFLSHEFLTSSSCGETRINCKKWPNQPMNWEERDNVFEDKNSCDVFAEIAHIYALGDKYTNIFKLKNPQTNEPILMGCYGIGISRLLGICFEKSDLGIIAPFEKTLITISNDSECINLAQQIFKNYEDIIWDDQNISPGEKFAQADLIKSPMQIHIGKKEANENKITIKISNTKKTITLEEFFNEYK